MAGYVQGFYFGGACTYGSEYNVEMHLITTVWEASLGCGPLHQYRIADHGRFLSTT